MNKMRLNLQSRILFSFFAIIIVASGLILTIMQLNEQNLRQHQAVMLQDKADQIASQLQIQIQQTRRNLSSQTQPLLQAIANKNRPTYQRAWQQLQISEPYLTHGQLIDAQGRIILDSQQDIATTSMVTPINPGPYINRALAGQQVVSQSYELNGQRYIDIYHPLTNTDLDKALGVHKVRMALEVPRQLQQDLQSQVHGQLYILDNLGNSIYQPSQPVSDPQLLLAQNVVQHSLGQSTESNNFYINAANISVVGAAKYIPDINWIVLVEQSQEQAFGHIVMTNNLLLLGLFISTIILVAIAVWLSNKIAQPVTTLTKAVKQLQHGRLRKAPVINTGDELEDLADAFTDMAGQLAERQKSLEQTNASLVIEKDRHSTLLQSLTSGVFATDAQGNIILFNKAAESITQLKAKAVLDRPADAALQFYHNDKLISIEDYANQNVRYKNRLRNKGLQFNTDHGDILLSLSVAPVSDDLGQQGGWVVSFHDITQERELEAMKLDFVSMAAHELRTPLTALRGYLSILEFEASQKLSAEEQTYLERSVISSGQLSSLVENLLNLSRIERGSLKLDLTPVQPEEMIKGALTNLHEVAKQRGVKIEFIEPSRPLPLIQADNFRIAEVLTNLTANAINYSKPENGWVKIQAVAKKNFVEISVSDNGQGIPSSSIPRMFTKFYRVQSSLAMGSKGTGLGLFISKSIVDAHKGKIWVESEVGVGSTFTFTVPLAPKGSKALIFGRTR